MILISSRHFTVRDDYMLDTLEFVLAVIAIVGIIYHTFHQGVGLVPVYYP